MAKRKNEEEPRETIVDLVKLLAEERAIDEEEVFQAIESGIVAAYKREFGGNKQDIKSVNAEIDREPFLLNCVDHRSGRLCLFICEFSKFPDLLCQRYRGF